MTKLAVGDRVKPHDKFNFKAYSGPRSLIDVGTVTKLINDSWVEVEWDSGATDDFELADHDPLNDVAVVLAA